MLWVLLFVVLRDAILAPKPVFRLNVDVEPYTRCILYIICLKFSEVEVLGFSDKSLSNVILDPEIAVIFLSSFNPDGRFIKHPSFTASPDADVSVKWLLSLKAEMLVKSVLASDKSNLDSTIILLLTFVIEIGTTLPISFSIVSVLFGTSNFVDNATYLYLKSAAVFTAVFNKSSK